MRSVDVQRFDLVPLDRPHILANGCAGSGYPAPVTDVYVRLPDIPDRNVLAVHLNTPPDAKSQKGPRVGFIPVDLHTGTVPADDDDDPFCPHGIPYEFCGNCHNEEEEQS